MKKALTRRQQAQIRNHNIMRLKGMYATANNIMHPLLAKKVTDAIDDQLISMNATTPAQDIKEVRKKLAK